MDNLLKLIYIGTQNYNNPILKSYLQRELDEIGQRVKSIDFWHTSDSNIISRVKEIIENRGLYLIATDREHFALLNQILLELNAKIQKDSTLNKNSYLYKINDSLINLISIELNQKIPKLLLNSESSYTWHIFPKTSLELKRLRELLLKNPDNLELIELIEGWIKITAYGKDTIELIQRELKAISKQIIPKKSIVESLIIYLSEQKKKITFAESCTGGLLASAFTAKSGASTILEGSYISYANRIKSNWLGVKEETLIKYGAVSKECVEEMALGAQKNLMADIAIAISGIAGPTGATEGKPVGTIYICLRNEENSQVIRLNIKGDRNAIQYQTLLYSLKYLVESEKNKIFDFFLKNP